MRKFNGIKLGMLKIALETRDHNTCFFCAEIGSDIMNYSHIPAMWRNELYYLIIWNLYVITDYVCLKDHLKNVYYVCNT